MVQLSANKPYFTVRIKFQKTGSLQYISHLDLVRTMHKIIVRADLPLWYTEGFNPKPKMIFAAPLSIGTESVCEFMDLRLTEVIDTDGIIARLNKNMAPEMRVTDAYYTDEKLTNLKWLAYSMRITTAGASEELSKRCRDHLLSDTVMVEKKGKPGDAPKVQNIAPMIKSAEVKLDGGDILIDCILSADASAFLNPEYVVKALKRECGILSSPDLTSEYYSIMRTFAYREDMSDFGSH